MKKIRRFLSAMLISIVGISSFSMPVYADVATPSEIVSIPEFTPEINLPVASSSDMQRPSLSLPSAIAGGVPSVTNSVDYSDVYMSVKYYNLTGQVVWKQVDVDSSGHFSITKPDNYSQFIALYLVINDGSLPYSGTYTFSFNVLPNAGGTNTWSNLILEAVQNLPNVTDSYAYQTISFQQDGWGQVYATSNINTSNYSSLRCSLYSVDDSWGWPFNGDVNVNFTKYYGSDLEGPVIDSNMTSGDVQQNINSTVTNISNAVSSVDDSIRELIQTISNQLTALWNQFAAEFTNFYTAWQNHTNSIVQAIQAISIAATDGIENIISSADKNAQDIQDNADKNTDQITNGYDNSGMTSENERLDGAISGYEDVENGIKDDVTGYIHDFDMPSWDNIFAVPGVLSAAGFIGGFMQDCFDGMGIWNIQITLSLTFIFVLMLIGYHRFRR